jgi:Zn-dependent protease
MDLSIQVFSIIVLIFSVVIHEVAHGFTALKFGDETAKYAGRLTLNPIKHIDLFGSIILPLILVILPGSLILGWAKPVPYNPYNFKNRRKGEFWVAFAGPLSNIVIGVIFIALIRLAPILGLSAGFITLAFVVVLINFVLALFNLIPIPPLDGSKILFSLLPFEQQDRFALFLQRWGLLLVVIFIFFLWTPLFNLLLYMLFLLTGMTAL